MPQIAPNSELLIAKLGEAAPDSKGVVAPSFRLEGLEVVSAMPYASGE